MIAASVRHEAILDFLEWLTPDEAFRDKLYGIAANYLVYANTKGMRHAETHDGSGGDDATRREAERDAGAPTMGAGSGDPRCTNCGDIVKLHAGGPEQPECEHKDVAPICDRHGEVIARECQDCGKRSFILH